MREALLSAVLTAWAAASYAEDPCSKGCLQLPNTQIDADGYARPWDANANAIWLVEDRSATTKKTLATLATLAKTTLDIPDDDARRAALKQDFQKLGAAYQKLFERVNATQFSLSNSDWYDIATGSAPLAANAINPAFGTLVGIAALNAVAYKDVINPSTESTADALWKVYEDSRSQIGKVIFADMLAADPTLVTSLNPDPVANPNLGHNLAQFQQDARAWMGAAQWDALPAPLKEQLIVELHRYAGDKPFLASLAQQSVQDRATARTAARGDAERLRSVESALALQKAALEDWPRITDSGLTSHWQDSPSVGMQQPLDRWAYSQLRTDEDRLEALRSGAFTSFSDDEVRDEIARLNKSVVDKQVARATTAIAWGRAFLGVAGVLGLPPEQAQQMTEVLDRTEALVNVVGGIALGGPVGYLAALQSVPALFGSTAPRQPDYVAQELKNINERLDTVLELQRQTLDEISTLRQENQTAFDAVLSSLSRLSAQVANLSTRDAADGELEISQCLKMQGTSAAVSVSIGVNVPVSGLFQSYEARAAFYNTRKAKFVKCFDLFDKLSPSIEVGATHKNLEFTVLNPAADAELSGFLNYVYAPALWLTRHVMLGSYPMGESTPQYMRWCHGNVILEASQRPRTVAQMRQAVTDSRDGCIRHTGFGDEQHPRFVWAGKSPAQFEAALTDEVRNQIAPPRPWLLLDRPLYPSFLQQYVNAAGFLSAFPAFVGKNGNMYSRASLRDRYDQNKPLTADGPLTWFNALDDLATLTEAQQVIASGTFLAATFADSLWRDGGFPRLAPAPTASVDRSDGEPFPVVGAVTVPFDYTNSTARQIADRRAELREGYERLAKVVAQDADEKQENDRKLAELDATVTFFESEKNFRENFEQWFNQLRQVGQLRDIELRRAADGKDSCKPTSADCVYPSFRPRYREHFYDPYVPGAFRLDIVNAGTPTWFAVYEQVQQDGLVALKDWAAMTRGSKTRWAANDGKLNDDAHPDDADCHIGVQAYEDFPADVLFCLAGTNPLVARNTAIALLNAAFQRALPGQSAAVRTQYVRAAITGSGNAFAPLMEAVFPGLSAGRDALADAASMFLYFRDWACEPKPDPKLVPPVSSNRPRRLSEVNPACGWQLVVRLPSGYPLMIPFPSVQQIAGGMLLQRREVDDMHRLREELAERLVLAGARRQLIDGPDADRLWTTSMASIALDPYYYCMAQGAIREYCLQYARVETAKGRVSPARPAAPVVAQH